MTFDPKTHKFGMAYRDYTGTVGVLIDYSHSMGFYLKDEYGKHFTVPRRNKLTRAPEHDLVPVKQRNEENAQIYNWLNAHIRIEDLKTHPEWKALKQLLGVQE